ncbi:hypothetical protein HMPREF1141_0163 [Clostridium sp. MSTE9]|nr:hypothetical protein HMPREF1141_0163 [Clostridium sp. MSTE9]
MRFDRKSDKMRLKFLARGLIQSNRTAAICPAAAVAALGRSGCFQT